MARNFRQEETDLDIWFDEEKEKLTESYLKKLDALNPKLEVSEEEDEEEKKKKKKAKAKKKDNDKLKKDLEKSFLGSMQQLRAQYQKRYDKIKTAEENSKKIKKKKDFVFTPFKFTFGGIARLSISSFNFVKKYSVLSFNATKNGITKFFSNISYSIKSNYTFHMRSKTSPVLWPVANKFRIFIVRPARRRKEQFASFRKQLVKSTSDFLGKALDFIIKYAKLALDALVKYFKLISGSIKGLQKKMSEFFNKYIKPVIPVPKKEE